MTSQGIHKKLFCVARAVVITLRYRDHVIDVGLYCHLQVAVITLCCDLCRPLLPPQKDKPHVASNLKTSCPRHRDFMQEAPAEKDTLGRLTERDIVARRIFSCAGKGPRLCMKFASDM